MTGEILGAAIIFLVTLLLAWPLGKYITKVFKGERTFMDFMNPLERFIFRFCGINPDESMNWKQFLNAFSQLDAPGQNVVYADVDGNIGYHTTGRIPIRATGDGSLPQDGSGNAHEWTGYIPFDKLPSVYNPPSGIIATANGRVTPDKYPYSISTGWEAPWRTDRIYQVLESGKKFSAADMLALQTDTYSSFDQFAAERFVYSIDRAHNPSSRVNRPPKSCVDGMGA